MSDHRSWSVSLGRWNGVHVHLHMFFILFSACTLYLGWRDGWSIASPSGLVWIGALSLTILLASVLLHELGHLQAAAQLGLPTEHIVLGPLGGLTPLPTAPTSNAKAELLICLAGPIVNLSICLLCIPLSWTVHDAALAPLLHPLHPEGVAIGSAAAVVLKLTFWINWVLALVNLLPAFPFDGVGALQAGMNLLWPKLSRRALAMMAARLGQFVALILLGLALYLFAATTPGASPDAVPTWFALALLAIFLFFSAKQEENRREEVDRSVDPFRDDFIDFDDETHRELDDFASEEQTWRPSPPQPNVFSRWLQHHRDRRRELRVQREQDEESRVDEILERLHAHGEQNLSNEDRLVLKRVSARYRDRLSNRA